jgi:aryl-alcohol dehydrogenase-like predicted oxidoreductase
MVPVTYFVCCGDRVRTIPGSDLTVFELCLGTNPFGWTADEQESFAVLDAYVAAGGNFIDTADVYSAWVDGHKGGESETVIGRWFASRGSRDEVVIATKIGADGGLGAENVAASVDGCLTRLGIDHIDLLYAHYDDANTPLAESLRALDGVIRAGKARYIAASNYEPTRLEQALEISEREGLASFVALEPHYNLLERAYEHTFAEPVARHRLGCIPYCGLARGFLTGKYRPGRSHVSDRGRQDGSAYMSEGGWRALAVLDELASANSTTNAAVALAWLLRQPTVVAPIASARTPEQLAEQLPMAELALTDVELQRLADAT